MLIKFENQHLDQGQQTYCWCQRTQSGLMTVLVNKILLEHSHVHWFKYCLWLPSHSDSGIRVQTIWPTSLEYLLFGHLKKVVYLPLLRESNT